MLAHSLTVHDANNNLYRTDVDSRLAIVQTKELCSAGPKFGEKDACSLRGRRHASEIPDWVAETRRVWQTFSNMSLSCVRCRPLLGCCSLLIRQESRQWYQMSVAHDMATTSQ